MLNYAVFNSKVMSGVFRSFSNIFLFLCFLMLFWGIPAHALDLQKIRFGVHPDKTRIVIELSNPSDFRAFVLPQEEGKPYRIVVDLPDFHWQAGTITRPAKTTITDVRSGNLTTGIMRVVVDLSKPAEIKTAFLLPQAGKNPDRLVIDFSSVSPAQFSVANQKVFGTLNNDQAQLNLLIAKESEKNVEASSTIVNANPSNGVIIPQRKPIASYSGTPPTTTKSPLRKPLIVIDAGHGGADSGAVGANRSHEKNVTLAAAKALREKLESTGRYRVHLTRDSDKYLKLYERRLIAHQKSADLFISLHADSISKPGVRGASIYTLSNKASDAQTAKLAARENQVDLIAGVDLSHEDKDVANILIDLAMRDTMNQSKFFANTVVSKMNAHGIRILEKPHRFAGFAVLKSADIPSVLVEMGFMSNKDEVRLLSSRDYQQKIASALTDSIDSYFQKVQENSVR